MKFFKNINTLEDLKKEYKRLSRIYHPDMPTGNLEDMQALNSEFDNLFKVYQYKTTINNNETAESFRSEFYTQNGWKGEKYSETANLSVKEVAKLIRNDLKSEFPECKFSVTTESASKIYVSLMESPYPAYMTKEEIIEAKNDKSIRGDHNHPLNKHRRINVNGKLVICNYLFNCESWKALTDEEFDAFCNDTKIPTEKITSILKKVDSIVSSYNREDIDAMIDYFNAKFYFKECEIGKWDKEYICNPELAKKIKQKKVETKTTTEITPQEQKTISEKTDIIKVDDVEIEIKIIDDTDTRDNSKIKVVKLITSLSREQYKAVQSYMKTKGGYYSKFKHGFIFKEKEVCFS